MLFDNSINHYDQGLDSNLSQKLKKSIVFVWVLHAPIYNELTIFCLFFISFIY